MGLADLLRGLPFCGSRRLAENADGGDDDKS
jgi:hypothetical protein